MDKLRQWTARIAFSVLLISVIYLLAGRRLFPIPTEGFSTNPSSLPYYSLLSLYRMAAAYALALAFSLAYGSAAALRKGAGRVMLPILDILQSVPVLGFFPAAIFLFVTLAGPGRLGVELAAIFLVFTSQAWNMTFGVYESLTTVPKDVRDVSALYGLSGTVAARRLYLPTAAAKLVHNSVLSWAGGWYFLVASEIIAAGPVRYQLPGIGSYLIVTSERGQFGRMLAGLAALLTIVVTMDLLLWRPLTVWSQKFKYEVAAGATPTRHSFLLGLFNRFRSDPLVAPLLRAAGRLLSLPFHALGATGHSVRLAYHRTGPFRTAAVWAGRVAMVASVSALMLLLAYAGYSTFLVFGRPFPPRAYSIPAAIGASFLRLLVAYLISLFWTVPVAIAVGSSKKLGRWLMPFFEIAASVPATALFPVIVVVIVAYTGSVNIAAILLVLTGMQWYLLFNLIAGVSALPEDFNEVARSMGVRGWLKWKRLMLPAVFPSLVTGSVTAWGGGWNALIVAEYFRYGSKTLSAFGIGSLLDEATYVTGDSRMILYSLIGMVGTIIILNKLVWRNLYDYASKRFRIEY